MKSYDFDAVTYGADVYCLDHLPDGVTLKDEEVHPIFADSEWDYYPRCCKCGVVHDYVSLLPQPPKKRDKTKPQDEYCKDCLIYKDGGCNVILKDDEDECGDKETRS